MQKTYNLAKALSLIALTVFLFSSLSAQAQPQTSYIIVHALNPEGIENASIEGMDPHCVEIYDDDTLIGYGAHNQETYNKPIAISFGAHTIKVIFNGMELSQNIALQEGEVKVLEFTFERTEFDLVSHLNSIACSRDVTKSGYARPGGQRGWFDYFQSVVEKDLSGGIHMSGFIENLFCGVIYYAHYKFHLDGNSFYSLIEGNLQLVTYTGYSAWQDMGVFYWTANQRHGYNWPDVVVIPSQSFDNWFIQESSRSGFYPPIDFARKDNPIIYYTYHDWRTVNEKKLQKIPAVEYRKAAWDIGHGHAFVVSPANPYDSFRDEASGEVYGLKMSSVPYDLTGTGIKYKETPLIITGATTDKPNYAIGEEAKMSCKVTDSYGATVSGAFVTAEIKKPDNSAETVSLSEIQAGTYEGTFANTSNPGTYKITLKATKPGYAPAVQTGLEFIVLSLELLDGVDFTAGREVSSDPEKLASGGTPVKGAVTDGVTRLLLRLNVDELNEVTFSIEGTGNPDEDGVLRSIDGGQEGESITVYTQDTGSGEKAFAIYQAPENFVRWDYRDQDSEVSERAITLKVKSNRSPSFEFSEEIKLIRPPVILVHGLWVGPEMWDEFSNRLRNILPGIRIFTINYQDTNASHFEDNIAALYNNKDNGIFDVKKKLRSEGIAMVQVDILGHSMGGLLARIWVGAGEDAYERENNFYEGDINKLITLDSPHYGSFLADVGMEYINDLDSRRREWVLRRFRAWGIALDGGAVEDLMTTSEPIRHMNTIEINSESHAIIGDYPVGSIEFWFLPGALGWAHRILTLAGYDTRPYVVQNRSDLVVSVESQTGGLDFSASSVFEHHHMNAIGENVVNRIIELLNTSPDSNLFEKGFPVRESSQ